MQVGSSMLSVTLVRECSKRILELAKDRQKLKQERADSGKLKKRIQGEGSGKPRKSGDPKEKRYVIDEEAFYNQKDGDDEDENSSGQKTKKTLGANTSPKKYDAQLKEPNLARRLGLDEEAMEKTKAEQDKDKNRKKTKEELEKEREIEEVRQIIEGDAKFNKYIKEVDLLGIDIDDHSSPNQPTGASKSKLQFIS